MGMNPFDFGSKKYTDIMKTQALKQALTKYEFDCGLRWERAVTKRSHAPKSASTRSETAHHQWDPKNQRPELWNIYNAKVKQG